jgi:pimeloyl-ACP methyl ester carboxylesterase
VQTTISRTILTVDGIHAPLLEARPAGARNDEAVVFVHGNPGSSQDWLPLLERAGRLARAVDVRSARRRCRFALSGRCGSRALRRSTWQG